MAALPSNVTAFMRLQICWTSDLAAEKLKNLIRSAMAAWRGLAEIKGKSEGRAILLDIVEQNIERLDELIEGHAENAQNEEESQLRRLRVDDSPESHRLRTHKAKCQSALYRGHAACQNYKKPHGAGRRGGGREQWSDSQGALIKSTDGRGTARRAGLNNPNLSWAYEPGGPYHRETPAGHGDGTKPGGGNGVNSEHVIAERDRHDTTIRENEANFDEDGRIAQEPVAVDVMANSDAQSGLDTGVKANFEEPEIEAVLDRLSPVIADCPAGIKGVGAVSEHVIVNREHRNSNSGENEANLDDHVNSAQESVAVDVMANSDVLWVLDTGVKANFAEPELELRSDLEDGRDEVISGVGGERAEEGRQAEPVSETESRRRRSASGSARRSGDGSAIKEGEKAAAAGDGATGNGAQAGGEEDGERLQIATRGLRVLTRSSRTWRWWLTSIICGRRDVRNRSLNMRRCWAWGERVW